MSGKNLVVFGATGEVGKHVVELGIKEGFKITAVVRENSTLDKENVTVLKGNLSDASFIDSCIAGQDIVISTLGYRIPSLAIWNQPIDPEYFPALATTIVNSMKKHGVKKLMMVSSSGVGDSYAKVSFVYKIIMNVTALKNIFPWLEKTENVFVNSGLDVCVVRPPLLTNGPFTGKGRVVEDHFGNHAISRVDLAKWMLDEVKKPSEFLQKYVLVTGN